MKQYAIFSNNPSNKTLIEQIFQYFKQIDKVIDCHIFSDNGLLMADQKIAILSTFYMSFYKENLIFLNIQDFLNNRDTTIAQKIYLYTSVEELLNANIDKQLLINTCLISHKNGILYEI